MSDPARAHQYDADLHDNQIVAMYDNALQAESAKTMLVANGFPAAAMRVLAQGKVLTDFAPETPTLPEGQSIWSAMASLFMPHDERTTFQSVVARGHAMLVVTGDPTMDRRHLIHLLEETHPFDFDARADQWRASGELPGTGYKNAPETTAGSPAAEDAAARYREGQREMPEGARRVRSYIAERPGQGTIETGAAEPEMPPRVPTGTNTPL